MIDKCSFMAALSSHGYNPIDEGGCIMIVTPDKSDLDKMQEIAEKGGFAGNGSYGWRKVKSEKTAIKQANTSEDESDEYIAENH